MSKILITSSKDGHMWYAKLIGVEVEMIREYDTHFIAREPSGYTNIVHKFDAELVRVLKYSTEDLYGTATLGMLEGERPFIKMRIAMLERTLIQENVKHWRGIDKHLIKEIDDGIKFWNDRLKEIR